MLAASLHIGHLCLVIVVKLCDPFRHAFKAEVQSDGYLFERLALEAATS